MTFSSNKTTDIFLMNGNFFDKTEFDTLIFLNSYTQGIKINKSHSKITCIYKHITQNTYIVNMRLCYLVFYKITTKMFLE